MNKKTAINAALTILGQAPYLLGRALESRHHETARYLRTAGTATDVVACVAERV